MANDLRFDIELGGINKTITSVTEANKVIRELTKNFVLAKQSGADLTGVMNQMQKALEIKTSLLAVSKGAVTVQQGMQGAQTASANASMALLNLNYVIRDSPYFFQNFALGVLAVGNNLNPLIDSFSRLRQEAGAKSLTTFALLKQALVGGAGISIAFSLVVTAIQAFVFWQARSKKAVEETNKELETQIGKLGDLSRVQLVGGRVKAMMENDQLINEVLGERQNEAKVKYGLSQGWSKEKIAIGLMSEEQKKQIENNKTIIQQSQWILDNRGLLAGIEAEIAGLKEKQAKSKDPNEIKKLEQEIKSLEKYKNELRGISKELKEIKLARGVRPTEGGGVSPTARRGFFSGVDVNKRFGMEQSENTKAYGINEVVKDAGVNLEMAKIAAQELGNTISQAFENGKIKLNEFINSLIAAISKMLLLRAITSFLTGGTSAVANVAIPSGGGVGIPSGMGFDATRFKKSGANTVNVQGKISVNKNKFVVDFENARDYYNNNAKLVTIGRD